MDKKQHMDQEEKSNTLLDDKQSSSLSVTSTQDITSDDTYSRSKNKWRHSYRHHSSIQNDKAPNNWHPSSKDICTGLSFSDRYALNSTTLVVLSICVILTIANIAVLGNMHRATESNIDLKGGDHITPCLDQESPDTCYEVRDLDKKLVYQFRDGKRYIGFSECSHDAPETKIEKCIGELTFSYKASSVWSYRLYEDTSTNKYSIVAGPHGADLTDDVFRVKHMLQSPWNWIISKDAIPKDDYPEYGLYVKGKIIHHDTE